MAVSPHLVGTQVVGTSIPPMSVKRPMDAGADPGGGGGSWGSGPPPPFLGDPQTS